jgi:fatty-acyl-CoA synthase
VTIFRGPPLEDEGGIGSLTLAAFLEEIAHTHGPRDAVVLHDGGPRWTYADLHTEARRVAKALVASGVDKGTRVAILLGNRPEWIATLFGTALAGGVAVPLNTYYEPPELEQVLRDCDAAVLVTQPQLAGHRYLDQLGRFRDRLPYLREVVSLADWEGFLLRGVDVDGGVVDARADAVTPADEALVLYTSGTSAEPRGIRHAHRAPALQSWRFARHLALTPDDRVWSGYPLFWSGGLAMIMGGTLAAGACLVLQERFDPGDALALLEREQVTTAQAWAYQTAEMEAHPAWASADLSALRNVADVSPLARHPTVQLARPWNAYAAYGLSETCTIVAALPADTAPEEREGCEGVILPGNEVRIVHPSTGDPLGPNEIGAIAVRGPTLMAGYVKALPEECFDADGYFLTGDAGYVDREWRFHWTGRTTEMIKVGGANVSPWEIEVALRRHPGLRAARALGVPHETLGEVVVVCAVARDEVEIGEDDVREFLRGTLAIYKIPRHVVFVGEDALPLAGTSKTRLDALRSLVLEHLSPGS